MTVSAYGLELTRRIGGVGSEAASQLELLAAIGLQQFS